MDIKGIFGFGKKTATGNAANEETAAKPAAATVKAPQIVPLQSVHHEKKAASHASLHSSKKQQGQAKKHTAVKKPAKKNEQMHKPAAKKQKVDPEALPVILGARGITAGIGDKQIVKNLSLTLRKGQIHVLMGPNGGGKSTLSNIIMGNPKYILEAGTIVFDGKDIIGMEVDERARQGIFLGFQYPLEIPGINLSQFMRTVVNIARKQKGLPQHSVMEFHNKMKDTLAYLNMPQEFADRHLNEGFSGGEKKRCEIVQMLLLEPKLAILDEPDSGLDIDSLKIVAQGIRRAADEGTTILLITHYQRLLNHVKPDFIHVIIDGSIVKEGDFSLAKELEKKGYEWLKDHDEEADARERARKLAVMGAGR